MPVAIENSQSDETGDVVSILYSLMELNQVRQRVYNKALVKTRDEKLKLVFLRYRTQSKAFANAFAVELRSYGNYALHQRVRFPDFRALWLKVNYIFPPSHREDIIMECESREDKSLRIYRRILSLKRLPYEAYIEIKRQKEHIEKAFREMISLSSLEALCQ
jgi:uncharacterized protein (TIGR02284 family)